MEILNKNELKLAKQLEKQNNISWQQYRERFEQTVPLEFWPTSINPEKISVVELECEIELIHNLSNMFKLKNLEKLPKIIAGFKKKITKDEILQLDYLDSNFVGLRRLFRKNVIDIMQKICADDFEAIPVTLISLNKNVEPFEIKDFYAINVLKCIKAIDEDNSNIKWSDTGANIIKFRYKENPWQAGCIPISGPNSPRGPAKYPQHHMDKPCMIAIDAVSGAIVWHPKLAGLLPSHPYFYFIQDFEQKP